MNFETVNHHYLIEVDNHIALLDLGSPSSFASENTVITLGNSTHHISANPGMIAQVNNSNLIEDRQIDMLLGLDILSEHSILLDKVNGTCTVDSQESSLGDMHILPIKTKSLMGQCYVTANAQFNGVDYDFILDTGAWIGYATSRIINGAPEIGRINDYSPIWGDIDTSKHNVDLLIAGCHDAAHPIGMMPSMLSMALGMIGIEIVMGIDDLVSQAILLDIPNSRVAFL